MPDPDAESTFAAIARLSLISAEIPIARLAAEFPGDGPATQEEKDAESAALGHSLATLMEAGRVVAYEIQHPSPTEKDDDGQPIMIPVPVVILTPLSAERLNLRLTPNSTRWVARTAKERPSKRSAVVRTIVETDLLGDQYNPLDEFVDPGAVDPHAEADRRERIARMRRGLASKADRERVGMLATPELIVMGGPNSWPLPGQDRGRYAPQAVPTDFEREKGRDGLTKYRGPCSACGGPGRPLASSPTTGCGACDRWWNDGGAGDVLKAGALEVAAAWRVKEGKVGKRDEEKGSGKGKGKGGRKEKRLKIQTNKMNRVKNEPADERYDD